MAHIVAFMFKLDAMRTQYRGDLANIAERIAENIAVRIFDIGLFPVKFPCVIAFGEWMKRKIH